MGTETCLSLTPAIRSSLQAKLERLLARPIIAEVVRTTSTADLPDESPSFFRALSFAARESQPKAGRSGQNGGWTENADEGTFTVRIRLDYDDQWRGCEKEILETVRSTIESPVTFLTNEQKTLLERSPREFLALNPRPESAELVDFDRELYGGSDRVVGLKVAALPDSPAHVRYIAIVPNLVQIERQLDALDEVERAADDGPLAPLRTLVGLSDASRIHALTAETTPVTLEPPLPDERLDEFQTECIQHAMATPHFAVIQGPPGSGKTTVITSVIRRAVARGDRVLVVSPTHVAVDNVVEKLVKRITDHPTEDRLEPHTMPVRYAARKGKLSDRAMEYWVGSKRQLRGATISRRVQQRLTEVVPIARSLYAKEDPNAIGNAPLSVSIAAIENVICGTPIGILSYATVKVAAPGEFDLLIVDEVSKMTLPEFLAIAVKAKRWVLVGDPEQLPPYNNSEENAPTLDEVFSPLLELVCSIGAFLERAKPHERRSERLVVVSTDPRKVAAAVQAHVAAVQLRDAPPIGVLDENTRAGIVVCSSDEIDKACDALSQMRGRDRTQTESSGSLGILVERGLKPPRPAFASGTRFVEPRRRAQALIYENAFNVYHAQPWSERSDQKLPLVGFRNGIEKYLPSGGAIESLEAELDQLQRAVRVRALRADVAARFAVNTVSVYDWLTGVPSECFDISPLRELQTLSQPGLREAVSPFTGTLKKQYRMHASISRVPRDLFYFGEALHDGKKDKSAECRVLFEQVSESDEAGSETNSHECERICQRLSELNATVPVQDRKPEIMLITPYRDQRAMLSKAIDDLRDKGRIDRLDVEALTLDSCQGREAEYVFISLVRSRATPFFDMPKRWNVALTRAMHGLVLVGNIDAYLQEAAKARRDPRSRTSRNGQDGMERSRPLMSLLARILEAYDRQIAEHRRSHA